MNQWTNSLYGNFRQRKFTDIWGSVDDFINDYNDNGIPTTIKGDSPNTLYYLLYARYGNSTIASSDENQFKYKVFTLIYQYGPTWEKNVEIQKELREMSLDEIMDGGKAIYNHSYNPSTEPSTDTIDELLTINDQNVTKYKKNKLEAYNFLTTLLQKDVTGYFLDKFKHLFLTIVEPELPLWYVTNLNDEEGDED